MPPLRVSRDNSMEAVRSALLRHANLTASPAWAIRERTGPTRASGLQPRHNDARILVGADLSRSAESRLPCRDLFARS